MDVAYHPEPWHEFAVMVGGASAALAGLLVVAMSINVDEILANDGLPRRAGAALLATISPLVLCMFLLVPEQPRTALGIELVGLGVVLALLLPYMNRPSARPQEQTTLQWLVFTCVPMVLLVVPLLLAGAGVLATAAGGLYWLPVSAIAALFGGLIQAWVLLIEIRR